MLGKRASWLAVSYRQIGRVGSGLSRPGSRLAALGWRHGHASVAAGCWARELVGWPCHAGKLAVPARAFLGPALGWLLSAGVMAMPLCRAS